MLLPAQRNCSLEFLRLCLRGEKTLIPMRNVRTFNFPPLRDFSVAALLEEYLGDVEVRAHLPDDIFAPERTFLHAVLGTLKPDEIGERIEEALKARGAAVENDEASQRIQVLPGIVEKLRATNAKPRAQL